MGGKTHKGIPMSVVIYPPHVLGMVQAICDKDTPKKEWFDLWLFLADWLEENEMPNAASHCKYHNAKNKDVDYELFRGGIERDCKIVLQITNGKPLQIGRLGEDTGKKEYPTGQKPILVKGQG